MTATEVFKLFLKKGDLDPNERLALVRTIRERIYSKDMVFYRYIWYGENIVDRQYMEKVFVQRLMQLTRYTTNSLGRNGYSSCCVSLTSFMRYLLHYIPSIIGTSKKKNKYLERINVEIPKNQGYKRYWELRLIKKWHEFLKKYISNGNAPFYYYTLVNYKLKEEVEI